MKLHFYTFWAINDRLNERELCHQLDAMRSYGFDGAVFHPRFYPNEPPYLSDAYLAILSRVILHTKSIGMDFWIYDENGWPSGTVGGELLKQFPNDAQQWADLTTEKPAPADCLGSFEHKGQQWFVACRCGAGVDYFSPELTQHFITMTHERYRQGLSLAAFAHISTFFCDEPEFGLGHAFDSLSPHGAVPWTPRLPELFRARYGEELEPKLTQIFFANDGGETRVKCWELLTDIFNESFIAPLNEWCHSHGKRFTAHVKGEEHPLFQVLTSGSCHQVFQHTALPGIDALGRFPSGHFFPRQVASVAQQFGNGECMAECFGGAGWGASPEEFENYLNWLAGHGLTHFVTHLWQFHLTTRAIQDWPPSHPVHVNWREVYPLILERVRKRFSAPYPAADMLVVAPYRGIMAEYKPCELLQTNIHNAATYPATTAGKMNTAFLQLLGRVHVSGANYHVSDERTIEEHGKVEDGVLHLGRCMYRNLVLSEGVKFNKEMAQQLATVAPPVCPSNERVSMSVAPSAKIQTGGMPVSWEVKTGMINDLVLEAEACGESSFIARFESAVALDVELYFVDDVSDITVRNVTLGSNRAFRCAAGQNEFRFVCGKVHVIPFVSARGQFAVRSKAPFIAGPKNVMATVGGFVLESMKPAMANDLIAGGFPFCREAITVSAVVELDCPASELCLTTVRADCAHVFVDGTDCGWCWGADWRVKLPKEIVAGCHTIEVWLVPSTFNFFGPHHHVASAISIREKFCRPSRCTGKHAGERLAFQTIWDWRCRSHPKWGAGRSNFMIQHEFITIDEGRATLLHINERDASRNWIVPVGRPQARDMQLAGDNRILIGHHHGYTEFDITTGKAMKEFTSLEGVTAVRRQPNGHTLIAGVNLADVTGVVVLELDASDRELHRAIFPGDYVRLIRQTEQGTYLMSCNDRIREGSRDGEYLREFPVQGFYHAWKSLRLPNGNLMVSAGYGAFVVELDPEGRVIRKFGGKESLPEKVRPFFYAMFQLLPNGNVVLANWQGHGEDPGVMGIQLLEFNSCGEIVWLWSKADLISSLQGVLVLDGLDTAKLHDERSGFMAPVL